MAVIRVTGDSMEPTLISGDLVLIDLSRRTIDPQGGIYAVSFGEEIMIKRLQQTYHSVKIISDNVKYDVIELTGDSIADLEINGKAIWYGRELER